MYGTHEHLVMEVLAALDSKRLLSGFTGMSNVVVIDSFQEAQRLAWSQFDTDIDVTWVDYRSEKMAEVMEARYTLEGFDGIDRQLGALVDHIGDVLLKRYKRTIFEVVVDDVSSDLYGIAYARAVGGSQFSFYEELMLVYANGGWPCGIRNGKLAAFSCR